MPDKPPNPVRDAVSVLLVFLCFTVLSVIIGTVVSSSKQSEVSEKKPTMKLKKMLAKRSVVLVDAFDGKEIKHWQSGKSLKDDHLVLIHAHTSKTDISPAMPELEFHVGQRIVTPVQAKLEVSYTRGNGARPGRSKEVDRVFIPADGGFRNIEGKAWKIHEDSDFMSEIAANGFFGGNAILTYRTGDTGQEKIIRFRIGGENPKDIQCEEFIQSFPQAAPGGKLDFMYAIARHESKVKNRNNVYYNQFLNLRTHKQKAGYPTWNNDGGLTPGGYGIFQVTGTAVDPDANIPRDTIWNWQSNVRTAFGLMNHQFKGSLAKRYFSRIKESSSDAEKILERCPPPDITVAGETFTARQAVWITAYNGWGGLLRDRFVFSENKPCGLGPGKRWQWNPPINSNGKTYLQLVAEEMN